MKNPWLDQWCLASEFFGNLRVYSWSDCRFDELVVFILYLVMTFVLLSRKIKSGSLQPVPDHVR